MVKNMKRGTIIGAGIIQTTSDVDVLRHQNKELSCFVRRLRRKLKATKTNLETQIIKEKELEALVSTLQRHWLELETTLTSILENYNNGDGIEPPVKKQKLNASKLVSVLPLLKYPGSRWLSKNPLQIVYEEEEEDDEHDGSDNEEKSCELAELEPKLKERVSFTINILKMLLDRIGRSGDSDSSISDKSVLTQLRDASSQAEAYLHRVIYLQKEIRRLKNNLEDANIARDVAIRRLNGWKSISHIESNGALKDMQIVKTEKKDGDEVDGKLKREEGAKDELMSEENLAKLEKLEEFELLANKRLDELEEARKERIALLQQIEEFRSKAFPLENGDLSNARIVETDSSSLNDTEDLQQEILKAKHEIIDLKQKLQRYDSLFLDLEKNAQERVNKEKESLRAEVKALNEQLVKQGDKLKAARSDKFEVDELNSRIRNFEKLLQASEDEKTLLNQRIERLEMSKPKLSTEDYRAELVKLISEGTNKNYSSLDEKEKEILHLKSLLKLKETELRDISEASEAYLNELDAMTQKGIGEKKQLQKALKKAAEKGTQNAKLMKSQLVLSEKIRKLQFNAKVKDGQLIQEQRLREPLEQEITALKEELASAKDLVQKAEKLATESDQAVRIYQTEIRQIKSELELNTEESTKIKAKLESFEKHNIQIQKERTDALYEANRAKEAHASMKRKLERMKSRQKFTNTSSHSDQTDLQLKVETMENYLRCPVYRQYWKDTIIITCCHMFSKKALMDNLAKRNRKCPTCKYNYSKDHLRDIVPYQENVEEDD